MTDTSRIHNNYTKNIAFPYNLIYTSIMSIKFLIQIKDVYEFIIPYSVVYKCIFLWVTDTSRIHNILKI